MKFTDGYWQMRHGFKPHYAAQVHAMEFESDGMTVYASTGKLVNRGDTINLPMLSIRFSSPLENVIRVQIFHHNGDNTHHPEFVLYESDQIEPEILGNEQYACFTSGQLCVQVHKGETWQVAYKAGERSLTSSTWHGMGFV